MEEVETVERLKAVGLLQRDEFGDWRVAALLRDDIDVVQVVLIHAQSRISLQHDVVEFSKTVELRGIVTAYIAVEHTEHGSRLDAIALTQRGIHRDSVLRIVHLVGRIDFFYLWPRFQCLHEVVGHALELGDGATAIVLNIQFHAVAIAIAKDSGEQEHEHRTTLYLMSGSLYTVVDAENVVTVLLAVVPMLQAPHHQSGVRTIATQNVPTRHGTGCQHVGIILQKFRHLLHRLLGVCQRRTSRRGDIDKDNAGVLVRNQTSRCGIEHPAHQNDADSRQGSHQPATAREPTQRPTVFR